MLKVGSVVYVVVGGGEGGERNELEFPGMSRDPQTEEYAYCWCRVILFSL